MHRILVVLALLLLSHSVVAQVDTPSTLLITGNVLRGNGVTPALNDSVIIFNPATGAIEEKGKVLSAQGLFAVTMTRTSAFDGTPLTLQFQQSGLRYQMLEGGSVSEGGAPADFQFLGGLVPRRVSTSATIGQQVGTAIGEPGPSTGGDGSGGDSGSGGTGGGVTPGVAEPAPAGSPFDVNDDGTVDQLDVELVKDVVADRTNDSTVVARADVNGDRIVNTRDIIAVIKAAGRAERGRRRARIEAQTTIETTVNRRR